ncbi:DUF1062 domain-containing protein [Streptomyces bohaiensis]|uniref:DUF1062 domain-containing protein n=1 Tax=Streptomyces bohaiensis TaxID=1431344 RepID=A0ABX1C3B1_9ACTN|nr:DUF1062 domain-containing protein [Streptomyces bohaiensis]NJQ13727.1 DUF1062 domain-containing protein [Streptomyces bohaiensis]
MSESPRGSVAALENWVVRPVRLPLVRRRCHVCATDGFRTSGKFRVNANHKLLDIWLLALCTGCDETTKLTVMERRHVRSIRPDLLDRMHLNDPDLAAEVLRNPVVRRRNHIGLDWTGAWSLDTGGASADADREITDVAVRFEAPIPVRPSRLIAEGCGRSRADIERLIEAGRLVSPARLSGRISGDFTFTLRS